MAHLDQSREKVDFTTATRRTGSISRPSVTKHLPRLERLEDRLAAGSLLLGGLGLSLWGDLNPRFDPKIHLFGELTPTRASDTPLKSPSAVSVALETGDSGIIVAAAVPQDDGGAVPVTNTTANQGNRAGIAPSRDGSRTLGENLPLDGEGAGMVHSIRGGLGIMAHREDAADNVVSVVDVPLAIGEGPGVMNPQSPQTPPLFSPDPRVKGNVPAHQKASQGETRLANVEVRPVDVNVTVKDCNSGRSGGRTPGFGTFDSMSGDDANLAIASGKGAKLGYIFAAGYKGNDASVTIVRPTGPNPCTQLTFPDPSGGGDPVVAEDIAVNQNGVWITGTINSFPTKGFVAKVRDAGMLGPLYVVFPLNPEVGVELHGIALGSNPNIPDVFVTGCGTPDIPDTPVNDIHIGDRFSGPGERHTGKDTLVIRFDEHLSIPLISPQYATNVHFDNFDGLQFKDSCGLAVDADRTNNAYVGGWFGDENSDQRNYTLKLDPPGTTLPWTGQGVFTVPASSPSCFVNNPRGGIYGVKFVGGTTTAGGVYTTGIPSDGCLNPGLDMLILAKRNPSSGTSIYSAPNAWLWHYSGFDFAGLEIDVDRAGNAYMTGWTGSPGIHDSFVFKVDPSGGTPVGFDSFGGSSVDGSHLKVQPPYPPAMGIALDTSLPNSDVLLAGYTESPDFQPILNPCPYPFVGTGVGYIAEYVQPLTAPGGFLTAVPV